MLEDVQKEKDKDIILPASIIAAAVIVSISLLYSKNSGKYQSEEAPKNNSSDYAAAMVLGERDVFLGESGAAVTFIEYGDYQCPFCGIFFNEVEPKLKNDYLQSGRARFVYRNYAFLGQESLAAANAAECAKDQGKFWQYHDLLFQSEIADNVENNGNLNKDLFMRFAGEAGLDKTRFENCLDNETYSQFIRDEATRALTYGVSGTPASFINGALVKGIARQDPYTQYKNAIEAALKGQN